MELIGLKQPANGPYPETDASSPHPHIHTCPMVSFCQDLRLKFNTYFLTVPREIIHVLPIPYSLI